MNNMNNPLENRTCVDRIISNISRGKKTKCHWIEETLQLKYSIIVVSGQNIVNIY